MRIAENITETVGNTPIVKLNASKWGIENDVWVKLEYFNPDASVKGRVAKQMILDAEAMGRIHAGATLIEATSGNTGIGLAMMAAARDYKLIIVMPESMSIERRKLMTHLGAELVLTPAAEGMTGAVKRALELNASIPNSLVMNQFENESNPKAHELSTSQEILRDTEGKFDIFVAGVGTGGTISGNAKGLKSAIPHLEVVAVEPEDSPVISGGNAGKHLIQGIGAGFIPQNFKSEWVDKVMTISNADAIQTARELARKEGILCGISSGANVAVALKLAKENSNKVILTIAPDTAERYLSTALFNEA